MHIYQSAGDNSQIWRQSPNWVTFPLTHICILNARLNFCLHIGGQEVEFSDLCCVRFMFMLKSFSKFCILIFIHFFGGGSDKKSGYEDFCGYFWRPF